MDAVPLRRLEDLRHKMHARWTCGAATSPETVIPAPLRHRAFKKRTCVPAVNLRELDIPLSSAHSSVHDHLHHTVDAKELHTTKLAVWYSRVLDTLRRSRRAIVCSALLQRMRHGLINRTRSQPKNQPRRGNSRSLSGHRNSKQGYQSRRSGTRKV